MADFTLEQLLAEKERRQQKTAPSRVSPGALAKRGNLRGPFTKGVGEFLQKKAVTETEPAEERAAKKFAIDQQAAELKAEQDAEDRRQEQIARHESREEFGGLSIAEAEEFEKIPVGVNEDGSIKREVKPKIERQIKEKALLAKGTQSASEEKREVEQATLSEEIEGLVESFSRARKEQGELPLVGQFAGDPGLSRVTGVIASGAGAIGFAPATSVFNKKRKAFATVVAKAAGEVRPTDVDIERFLGTLMNPNLTDAENELIMLDLLKKVEQGGDVVAIDLWRQATGKEIGESIPESARLDLSEADQAEIAAIDKELAELEAQ